MSTYPTFEDRRRRSVRSELRVLSPATARSALTEAVNRGDHRAMSECSACNKGTVKRGTTTATFEADGTTVVVRNVPADVCDACGEGYYDPITTERLLELAADAAGWSAAPVQICDYTF